MKIVIRDYQKEVIEKIINNINNGIKRKLKFLTTNPISII